jgi:HEAT repeat protein
MATREEVTALMQGDEFDRLIDILRMGEEAVPILLDIMKDSSAPAFMRHRATATLGEIRSPTAAPDIRAALNDDDPVERIMAARALVQIEGPDAAAALTPLLQDADPSVSIVAMQGLAQVGDQTALAALENLGTDSPDAAVRSEAQAAIIKIQDRDAKA